MSDVSDTVDVWDCIEAGDLENVKKGISEEAFPLNSTFFNGQTMLMWSISCQQLDVTKFLIYAGVDIDQLSFGREQYTALHLALRNNDLSAAKILLEAGADTEIYWSTPVFNPDSPEVGQQLTSTLSMALSNGEDELVDLILEKVSDEQINGHHLDDQPRPLIDAIGRNDVEVVKKLLARGADPNKPDDERTPLMFAAQRTSVLVELLLGLPNIKPHIRDKGDWSALEYAVQLSKWDNARLLWEAGVDSKMMRPNRYAHGTWVRPFMKNCPRPRSGGAIAAHGTCLYVFGGDSNGNGIYNPGSATNLGEEAEYLADFWKLDFSKVLFEDFSARFKKADISQNTLEGDDENKNLLIEDLNVTCIDDDEESFDGFGSVVGKTPFSKSTGFAYFEVSLEKLPELATVAIGFVSTACAPNFLPGWEQGSIALHSDDGQAFRDNCPIPWGPRFFKGDVVGAGIDFESEQFFFTLNGEFLGVAFFGLQSWIKEYYPCVGLTHSGTSLNVNFGATPFRFDLRCPVLYWNEIPFAIERPDFINIHGMIAVDDQLMLLGDERNHLDSVFMFDTKSEKWSIASSPGPKSTRIYFPNGVGIACIDGVVYTSKGASPDIFQSHVVSNNVYSCKTLVSDGAPLEKVREQILDEADLTSDVLSRYPEISDTSTPDLEKLNATRTADIMNYAYGGITGVQCQNQLCFASTVDFAVFDPKTLQLNVSPCSRSGPNLKAAAMAGLSDLILSYGGSDQIRARTDLALLDTKTLEWGRPLLSGIVPRSRGLSKAVGMCFSIDNPIFGYSLIDSLKSASNQQYTQTNLRNPPDGAQNREDVKKGQIECFVIFGGWNGWNHLNDLEIFVPTPHLVLKSNSWQAEPNSATFITFEVCDPQTQEKEFLNVEPGLISARSSVVQKLLSSCTPKAVFQIKTKTSHFKALLEFLNSDIAIFPYSGQEARDFYSMVKEWAPEHADRVGQSLILDYPFAPSTWSSDLDALFESSEHSDVELVFEGKNMKAHKEVLKRNEYFKRLLGGGLMESSLKTILLDCPFDLSHHLIRFIYTRSIDLDVIEEDILELFELSDKFCIDELKRRLEGVLSFNLSVENAVSILELARTHNSPQLVASCLNFIESNPEVIQSQEYENYCKREPLHEAK